MTSELANQFLIAMPSLQDPNFYQSVTYLFQHDEEGAIGIVINKPSNIHTYELLAKFKLESMQSNDQSPVLIGGPVQTDKGFVLHQPIGSWDSTLHMYETLAITTSPDILQAIADNRGPERMVIALGYAGWGPGQLEREMSENAWLSTPCDPKIIFDTPVEQRWQRATALLGIDINQLSTQTGHA